MNNLSLKNNLQKNSPKKLRCGFLSNFTFVVAFLGVVCVSSLVQAKEVYVGFHELKEHSANFPANVTVKDILEKLEIIILDINNDNDIDFLRLDPNVAFIEEASTSLGPKKMVSKPYVTHDKKSLLSSGPRGGGGRKPDQRHTQGPVVVPKGVELVEADRVWERYTRGQGVRVLVLDSGLDAEHPEFLRTFEKGRNFMDSNQNNFRDEVGHGTHVAGTIAGSYSVLGVAPQVKILVGKVCNRGCSSSGILRGVEWGITERVDVINMSLGGPLGTNTAQRVYERAEQSNIVVVAASGNDGERKFSFPASYSQVFSVGAVDFNLTIAPFSNWNNNLDVVAPGVDVFSAVPRGSGRAANAAVVVSQQSLDVNVIPMVGSGIGELSNTAMEYVGLGLESDYVDKNVNGKVALVERGETTFKEKYDLAVNNGASAVLIFNNAPGEIRATLDADVEKVALTTDQATGRMLRDLVLSNGDEVKARVAIVPTDYKENSGTSMASPHVAGIAALIKSHNPQLSAVEIKEILRRAAAPVPQATFPERYGRGFISALRAIE